MTLRFAPIETNRFELNDIGASLGLVERGEVWGVTHRAHKLPSYYPQMTGQTWNKLKCCFH